MAGEAEPRSIGKMMCETRDAVHRYHDAHEVLGDVGRRIMEAHDGDMTPTDVERFEWEMARADMKQREAELIRLILAWQPAHVEMTRGEPSRPEWKPRGLLFEGTTYILVRSVPGDDDDETSVPIDDDARLGLPCEMVWHLETVVTDHLIDLDEAFAD